MGVEPPFLYDHPTKYSFVGPTEKAFDPKAASRASWSPPRPRPKIDGPLISSKEFNRHPDSYFVVPYGNLDYKPMSKRTKPKVKWTRWVQLFLRTCELLGTLGLLFCVICIKGTDATTGWIIRIPPAVAILHTVYAIYHLSRSSKGRTPASSASYMLFAAIIDAGLMPFLVFTALISRTEYIQPVNAPGHWSTLFGGDEATTKIIHTTFLISVVSGSMHLVSLILSVYLGVVFRKISRLPPDMNPLEGNLTSRHKRNNSSLLDSDRTNTATTASPNKRRSQVDDPLISTSRTVPFMHTRNESRDNIAKVPESTSSPRMSRIDLTTPFYDQPPAHRSSQTNIKGPMYRQGTSQRGSQLDTSGQFREQLMSRLDAGAGPHPNDLSQASPAKTSPSELQRSPTKSSSIYSTSTITTIATGRPGSVRPRSTAPTLPDSNWITHPSPSSSPSPPRELQHLRNKSSYQPLSQTEPFEYTSNDENMLPKPLMMNPPTPPMQIQRMQVQRQLQNMEQRALTPGNGNHGRGNWGFGPGTVGIGKARAWGELGQPRGGGGGGTRVVSRSGVEVRDGGILPNGGIRAREVSGKIMEEGRGGAGQWR